MSERSGGREQSEQSRASKWVSGVSERANGRASGPVLQSVFLAVIDHSESEEDNKRSSLFPSFYISSSGWKTTVSKILSHDAFPWDRDCESAGIPESYCACLNSWAWCNVRIAIVGSKSSTRAGFRHLFSLAFTLSLILFLSLFLLSPSHWLFLSSSHSLC